MVASKKEAVYRSLPLFFQSKKVKEKKKVLKELTHLLSELNKSSRGRGVQTRTILDVVRYCLEEDKLNPYNGDEWWITPSGKKMSFHAVRYEFWRVYLKEGGLTEGIRDMESSLRLGWAPIGRVKREYKRLMAIDKTMSNKLAGMSYKEVWFSETTKQLVKAKESYDYLLEVGDLDLFIHEAAEVFAFQPFEPDWWSQNPQPKIGGTSIIEFKAFILRILIDAKFNGRNFGGDFRTANKYFLISR